MSDRNPYGDYRSGSFVEHPRKELTLTTRLNVSVISRLSILRASAATTVSKVTLQRYASIC
jgi:hypothetical protein